MKKTIETKKVLMTLAKRYNMYSEACKLNIGDGGPIEEGLKDAAFREGANAIEKILKELGFKEDIDYKREMKKEILASGHSIEFLIIKPKA